MKTDLPKTYYVLYDGDCAFCCMIVKILNKNNAKKNLLLIAVQDIEARNILRKHNINFVNLNTIYFIADNSVYTKSTAVFNILKQLKLPLKIFVIFSVLPTKLTDFIYDFVAKNRHRLFIKK